MTREEAFIEINQIQDGYINELILLMNNSAYDSIKMLNFTSATGTGKTKMMSKLINKFPDYYFIITTLSKGQLHNQIRDNLAKDCHQDNFYVYGSADFKINSKLDAESIISKIPENTKCIWLRDEGHIRTNRWDELLLNICWKVINFSATNTYSDIKCNFTQTMMLRTVNQNCGTPEDAIKKLLEIKKVHKCVKGYNPCAIFRCVSDNNTIQQIIVDLCKKYKLKYIDITDESFVMKDICEDDNEYDVIINKFKIVEGIDIRRAHIIYMDNKPGNNATTIQVIGRCRRNALLYRDDIDILDPENKKLLKQTRECYVYYNVDKMKINTDETGELQYAFCDHISCQSLKPNSTVYVENGQLNNGLYIIELKGKTGYFHIINNKLGFNEVQESIPFYNTIEENYQHSIILGRLHKIKSRQHMHKVILPKKENIVFRNKHKQFDYSTGKYKLVEINPYICLNDLHFDCSYYTHKFTKSDLVELEKAKNNYINFIEHNVLSMSTILDEIKNDNFCNTNIKLKDITVDDVLNIIKNYIETYKDTMGYITKCKELNREITRHNNHDYSLESILDIFMPKYYKQIYKIQSSQIHYGYYATCINEYAKKLKYSQDIEFIDITEILNFNYVDHILNYIDFYYINEENIIENIINDLFKKYEFIENTKYIMTNKKEYIEYINNQFDLLKNTILTGLTVQGVNRVFSKDRYISIPEKDFNIYRYSYYEEYTKVSESFIEYLYKYVPYTKVTNDKESAIIGVDLMHQIEGNWIESRSVSSKIGNYNKFNSFISTKYNKELELAKTQYTKGKNEFKLDKKCNSVIGYVVEYYSKYLVYGKKYLGKFIDDAKKESKTTTENEYIIIRACMLKYKEMMAHSFGDKSVKLIKTISVTKLIQDNYKYFCKLVIKLATQTAEFVKDTLYPDSIPEDKIDPNLSIKHIAGLADYITENTILDIKVQGNLNENQVRQVLAYQYLSTKRSDLNIKRVIVYDATSGNHITINIQPDNWKENQEYGYKD